MTPVQEEIDNELQSNLKKDINKKDFICQKYTCPLCNKEIDTKLNFSSVNRHIDECLKQSQA